MNDQTVTPNVTPELPRPHRPKKRLDVYATPEALRGDYHDKVLVLGGEPERVLFVATSLQEALEYAKNTPAPVGGYHIAPGTPSVPLTVEEIEMRFNKG